jgi:hypothetical protein
MADERDWRLTSQEKYLMEAVLEWKPYRAPDPAWDHDHCEFCWQRFAEPDAGYSDSVEWGYVAEDFYWVCEECFHDFKQRFRWTVMDETSSAPEVKR